MRKEPLVVLAGGVCLVSLFFYYVNVERFIFKTIVYCESLIHPGSANARPSFASKFLKFVAESDAGNENSKSNKFPSPEIMRKQFDKKINKLINYRIPRSFEASFQIINETINNLWIKPIKTTGNEHLIIYMHGGGFVEGSINSYKAFVSRILPHLGENIIFVIPEYRLAPEHVLPAAIEDCVNVYKWLIEDGKYDPKKIIFMGDSAGGNLVFSTTLKILEENQLPTPGKLVALSPWIDLTLSQESYIRNNPLDPLCKTNFVRHCSGLAAPAESDKKKHSPLFASPDLLAKLPPIYIAVGENEIFYDEGLLIAQRIKDSAPNKVVELEVSTGQFHDFSLFVDWIPEAVESMAAIKKFINKE